jgi:hypothetical protein
MFPSSGVGLKIPTQLDPLGVFTAPHLRREIDPDSETLCFLVSRIPDDRRSPKIQQFWVLYTIVRSLQNLIVSCFISTYCSGSEEGKFIMTTITKMTVMTTRWWCLRWQKNYATALKIEIVSSELHHKKHFWYTDFLFHSDFYSATSFC